MLSYNRIIIKNLLFYFSFWLKCIMDIKDCELRLKSERKKSTLCPMKFEILR